MRKKSLPALFLALALLSGCAALPAAIPPAATDAPAATARSGQPEPTATPAMAPTPSPTPAPTATPEPTPVPTPTPLPEAQPTPEPKAMTYEEVDALLRAKGAVCAVAYLGESSEALAVGSPLMLAAGGYNWLYPFLGSSSAVQLVEWKGSQVYAVIPRSDAAVTCYEFYMNKDYSFTDGLGQYISTGAPGQCVILNCGASVTMPNLILLIDSGDGQVRYIPRVTLGDGQLLTDDSRVLDLTIYDFKLNT